MRQLETAGQHALVARLREEMAAAHEPRLSADPLWTRQRADLAGAVAASDPRRFLTWGFIRYSMFVAPHGRDSMVDAELAALRSSHDWSAVWRSALVEDAAGCPYPYSRLPASSGNLIHHAYHVHQLHETAGRALGSFERVIEFGGGYGSLARLAFRLGFGGRYEIYDLPEFRALQRYYISSVADLRNEPRFAERFFTLSSPPAVRSDDALFVALWSLSETPLAVREPWTEVIRGCGTVLLGCQKRFSDFDNEKWFARLVDQTPEHHWSHPGPTGQGSFYAVGVRAR